MQKFSDCMPLVNLLRGDVQVEQKLAKFEAEAETFPPRHRQLTAIRYYLHEVLWKCQKRWREQHGGITNYSTFLDAVEHWRHENNEKVCYVTFNYDTMLEESIESRWRIPFSDFSSYITPHYLTLIKLHGSIDWGLEFETYPLNRPFSFDEVISESARGLNLSNRFRKIRHAPVTFDDGKIGFPALAIPVEKKREFNCPPEHLRALAEVLPRVTKMITIGWRATEQHFLDMLKKRLSGLPGDVDLMTVSGTLGGARDTVNNLAIDNSARRKRELKANGFSGLIMEIDQLEAFLRA